MVYIQNY